MALNAFCLLFGFSALLANGLRSAQPAELNTNQQVVPEIHFYIFSFSILVS